jgi:hypothetical protein
MTISKQLEIGLWREQACYECKAGQPGKSGAHKVTLKILLITLKVASEVMFVVPIRNFDSDVSKKILKLFL